MICPNRCLLAESKVIDSRTHGPYTRRRRECLKCLCRWNTYEIPEEVAAKIMCKRVDCGNPRHFSGGRFRTECKVHYRETNNVYVRNSYKARKLNIKLKAST